MMLTALLSVFVAVVHGAEAAPEARVLGYALAPGEVRAHTVELALDTRVASRTGSEEVVRQTSTVVSFRVLTLGLRRASTEAMVVELAVRGFRLGVLTRTGASVVEWTMDERGITLRRQGEKPQHVPWANVPRGRGGEVGELIDRPMWCTIDERGSTLRLDGRMGPWSRVLDSMDLTPLMVPLWPLPAAAVEPGMSWTVTERAPVRLTEPWGEVELTRQTVMSLVGFEAHGEATVARLAFVRTVSPVDSRPHFRYEVTMKGEVVLGLDGALVGGEADVTVAAAALVLDAQYELAGTGRLRFNPTEEATAD